MSLLKGLNFLGNINKFLEELLDKRILLVVGEINCVKFDVKLRLVHEKDYFGGGAVVCEPVQPDHNE